MPFQRFGIRFEEPGTVPPPSEVIAAFLVMPGLYLHIPFCRTICPYCPYNKVRYRPALATDYMQALEREIAMYLAEEPGPFPSLYVGGGTPTLCLDELEPLVESMPITGERAIEVRGRGSSRTPTWDLVDQFEGADLFEWSTRPATNTINSPRPRRSGLA